MKISYKSKNENIIKNIDENVEFISNKIENIINENRIIDKNKDKINENMIKSIDYIVSKQLIKYN